MTDIEEPKQNADTSGKIAEILFDAFNSFYDYIVEKDQVKAAEEYSKKTFYYKAEERLLALIAAKTTEARIEALKHLGMYEQTRKVISRKMVSIYDETFVPSVDIANYIGELAQLQALSEEDRQ